jgi:WD40 repeat protein
MEAEVFRSEEAPLFARKHRSYVSPLFIRTATWLALGSTWTGFAPRAGAQGSPGGRPSLARLDPARISAEERFPWQPKGLVAIIGSHRGHHWGRSRALAFRPDGRQIASGGDDSAIRLWDAATLRELAVLEGHQGQVLAVAYSPDGKRLASGSWDGFVRLWDLSGARPRPLATLDPTEGLPVVGRPVVHAFGQRPPIDLVAFSPDGKTLAGASSQQETLAPTKPAVRRWDLTSDPPELLPTLGQPLSTGIPTMLGPLAFWPDGTTLAIEGRSGVALWDLPITRPDPRRVIPHPGQGRLYALAVSPDGKLFAGGLERDATDHFSGPGHFHRVVVLWDVSGPQPKALAQLKDFCDDASPGFAQAIAFRPDGKTLAFVGKGGKVQLWDLLSEGPRRSAVLDGGPRAWGTLAFSPDGKILACTTDGVTIWDLTGPTPTARRGFAPCDRITSASDGRLIAVRGDEIEHWDLSGEAPRREPGPALPAKSRLRLLAQGGTIIGGEEGKVRRIDWVGGESRESREISLPPDHYPVAWVADGRTLVAQSGYRTGNPMVSLFEVSGAEAKPRGELRGARSLLAIARGGTTAVAYAAGDGGAFSSVRLWDLSTDPPVDRGELRGEPRPRWTTSITTTIDGTGRADVKEHRRRDSPPKPARYHTAALTTDGRTAALGEWDGDIDLWDTSGPVPRQRATLVGHEPDRTWPLLRSMAFSPDGRRLVSSAGNGLVIIWDVAASKESLRWQLPGEVEQVLFAPDGRHVITCNGDSTVYVLRLPPWRRMIDEQITDPRRGERSVGGWGSGPLLSRREPYHLRGQQFAAINFAFERARNAAMRMDFQTTRQTLIAKVYQIWCYEERVARHLARPLSPAT